MTKNATTTTTTTTNTNNIPLPSKVVITCGTYDGVLAGWELSKDQTLEIKFATTVHGGSVRSVCLANAAPKQQQHPQQYPLLLSTGYDEMLKTHDWHRRLTSSGEVRTPADMGTPVCASFAPPYTSSASSSMPSTHCLIGFSGSGKLVIYKKRDWSIQHVLAGHVGGVASIAVHPSGSLALTGGYSDGKLKLWDLTKGRLSFVNTEKTKQPISTLVWSLDATCYAFCFENYVTVRHVATGKDWLHVALPSRVNQICLLQGPEGLFVAAACNDGSLPVLAVRTFVDDNNAGDEKRAVMAIEPVEGPVAGEERYKCIHTICGYYVVTANSAGVVSLMDLQGAIRMIMTPSSSNDGDDNPQTNENPAGSDKDDDESDNDDKQAKDGKDDDEGEEELAVEIIDAVQLGSGARITCLVAWASNADDDNADDDEQDDNSENDNDSDSEKNEQEEEAAQTAQNDKKRKMVGGNKRQHDIEMDPKDVEKARALVAKAKKMKKRKDSQKLK